MAMTKTSQSQDKFRTLGGAPAAEAEELGGDPGLPSPPAASFLPLCACSGPRSPGPQGVWAPGKVSDLIFALKAFTQGHFRSPTLSRGSVWPSSQTAYS